MSPEYLFEVSWEVCNKVGGIHTVVSTKACSLAAELKDNLIMIGPDVWRESMDNPEFTEDRNLYRAWCEQAASEGLRIRTGRWNIEGNPVVIIVDFTPFIAKKDDVFKSLWETYHLDSISGAWDYIEPALFGYAAGKVIESFCRFNLTSRTRVVAQFHEWMTGTGVLYLREYAPQIATAFTTHATVIGRALAGNGYPLYQNLAEYSGDEKALEFNVVSKHSLEKLSARTADVFTTVSQITAAECRQFLEKEIDLVTPNGFDDSFVPVPGIFEEKRIKARNRLRSVAEALTGNILPEDVIFTATSGRYEFHNKGIDLFIDAMALLNKKSEKLCTKVIAFILVPANHYGPRKDLLAWINKEEHCPEQSNNILTHLLHDQEYDPVLGRMKKLGFQNNRDEMVNIVFVPCYLNGNDGIFDLAYYDLLIGFDLTIFPSYYEPWGYTPLESVAFSIPTVTTSLSGFGRWVNDHSGELNGGTEVITRNDDNETEVTEKIAACISCYCSKNQEERQTAHDSAFQVSRTALWQNFINHYKEAYTIALGKLSGREEQISLIRQPLTEYVKRNGFSKPIWKKTMVESKLPEKLQGLWQLSRNLWWSWNYEAKELFESIGAPLWNEARYNPIRLLESLTIEQIQQLEGNDVFMENYRRVYGKFMEYMDVPAPQDKRKIAYFSMEFGFSDNLKIFSGGLGILAGDYLKEASDSNIDITGIGLLYRYGYFRQNISLSGEQIADYKPQLFSHLPVIPVKDKDGNWKKIGIAFPGRTLVAKIWLVNVGRIKLYLLDTDIDDNDSVDRTVTHQLYGGYEENRFKQEMLLGIGGIRALETLDIVPEIYHCNEGHAAFIGMERLRRLITENNLSFAEALEVVRSSSLFTTHTPVPAGHDSFTEDLLRAYMAHYPARLNIGWTDFINLGKIHPEDRNERFSMSLLAANLSQEINGVSMLHGKVSKEILSPLWPGYYPEENQVGYVTNGVHYKTWTTKAWQELYEREFGNKFCENLADKTYWQKIRNVPDEVIWDLRLKERKMLTDYIKERIDRNWIPRHENPKKLMEVKDRLNENTLTIGFARRFATYKRANLLFRNPERLKKIVNNPNMPVQFIFAGKAHPNDGAGQAIIKKIVEFSNQPEFLGKIIFLENYDIDLARKLVSGVDVWLNTPTRPMEASGTSGMKAVMNGVLHFSVLDGWWVEGYREQAGWALPQEATYENPESQDDLDAEVSYSILEHEIIPLFYKHNGDNLPHGWVACIKNSIAEIAPNFTTKRMLEDYENKYYHKLFDRASMINENDFEAAKIIASWKKKFTRAWESIVVLDYSLPGTGSEPLFLGKTYHCEVHIDLNEMPESDLGVELVTGTGNDDDIRILSVDELQLKQIKDRKATYVTDVSLSKPGVLNYGFRIFPKNPLLPHRQDFGLVKWI
ncbi:MAG: alpha-glucan family phosphorylase [Bacteroidia bacterium]|nr:alpha-glucan family phosphorylase [Bacteroidia bacterium]